MPLLLLKVIFTQTTKCYRQYNELKGLWTKIFSHFINEVTRKLLTQKTMGYT